MAWGPWRIAYTLKLPRNTICVTTDGGRRAVSYIAGRKSISVNRWAVLDLYQSELGFGRRCVVHKQGRFIPPPPGDNPIEVPPPYPRPTTGIEED